MELVNQREFERRTGIGESTIRSWISRNMLPPECFCYDEKGKRKIYYELAFIKAKELRPEIVNHVFETRETTKHKKDHYKVEPKEVEIVAELVKLEEPEAPEFVAEAMELMEEVDKEKQARKKPKKVFTAGTAAHPNPVGESNQVKDELSRLEIQEKELKVKGLQLKVEELEKRLVSRELVYKALFLFGAEVREYLNIIPERCIDRIRDAETRAEAMHILRGELTDALFCLTDEEIEARDITIKT